MPHDIDPLSAASHALGHDAVDVAIELVATLVKVRDLALADRAGNPATWPGFGSTEPEVIGRRVVASFLNAGWRPPSDTKVAAAADRARRTWTVINDWLESLSEVDSARAKAFYGEHGTWPDDLRPPRA